LAGSKAVGFAPGGFFIDCKSGGMPEDCLKESAMIKVGIVGGTGYTGVELLRISCRASGSAAERHHLA
jgi:hypothetical protein